MSDKVKIKIDEREILAENGANLLATALANGVKIPHFCWHECLPVSGNCRLCAVEVKGMRGLQISCNTAVKEGMEVTTNSDKVRAFRKSVLEFLLANHPLDCPVCDKSYECPLQNYTFEYGTHTSWMDDADKTSQKRRFERRNVSDVLFVEMDRCIHCSRCVRYFAEKTGERAFGLTWRGFTTLVDAVDKIESGFQLNSVDLCPTGALGERNFRFKMRAWDLIKRPSVCAECAAGCNCWVESKDDAVYRVTPRRCDEVNSIWMCDAGRLAFDDANSKARAGSPSVKSGGAREEKSFESAVSSAADKIKKIAAASGPRSIAVYVSARLTCEEMYAAKRFAEALGAGLVGSIAGAAEECPPVNSDILPKTLVSADKRPNSACARILDIAGCGGDFLKSLIDAANGGKIKALLAFGCDLELDAEILQKLDFILAAGVEAQTALARASDVFFPTVTHYEKQGFFVNRAGFAQTFFPAVKRTDLKEAKPEFEAIAALAASLGLDAPRSIEEARAEIIKSQPFAALNFAKLTPSSPQKIKPNG